MGCGSVRFYLFLSTVCNLLSLLCSENQASKMEDFYRRSAYLMQEMEHREKLSHRPVLFFLGKNEYPLRNISFCLAIFLNLLIIFYYGFVPTPHPPLLLRQYTDTLMQSRGNNRSWPYWPYLCEYLDKHAAVFLGPIPDRNIASQSSHSLSVPWTSNDAETMEED